VDRGFPQAETFLWRRIKGEKFSSARVSVGTAASSRDAYHLRHNTCQTTFYYCMVEQRLHTYRTNWTLLLFASDTLARNGRL